MKINYIKKPKYCKDCYTELGWTRGMRLPATFYNTSSAGIEIKGFWYCITCKTSKAGGTFKVPYTEDYTTY